MSIAGSSKDYFTNTITIIWWGKTPSENSLRKYAKKYYGCEDGYLEIIRESSGYKGLENTGSAQLKPLTPNTNEACMNDRKYTVNEIDELRDVCRKIVLWGTVHPSHGAISRTFRSDSDIYDSTERMVRTYMAAGLTAEDLYNKKSTSTQP